MRHEVKRNSHRHYIGEKNDTMLSKDTSRKPSPRAARNLSREVTGSKRSLTACRVNSFADDDASHALQHVMRHASCHVWSRDAERLRVMKCDDAGRH